MKTYIWFALIPLIFLQFSCNLSNLNSEPENNKSFYSLIDSLNPLPAFSVPRKGNIINLQTGTVISQNDLETGFEEIINKNNTGLKLLISKDAKISLIAAYGSDNKYHAVNSF